jgi:hypothetical protein
MNSKVSKLIRKSIKANTGFEGKELKKAIKLAKLEYYKLDKVKRAKVKLFYTTWPRSSLL